MPVRDRDDAGFPVNQPEYVIGQYPDFHLLRAEEVVKSGEARFGGVPEVFGE